MTKLSKLLAMRLSQLFLFIYLSSCSDECDGIDCFSQDSFAFTVKSDASGKDLLFGNNPQLSKDDIEVFYMKDGVEKAPLVRFDNRSVMVGLVGHVENYHIRVLNKTDLVNIQSKHIGSTKCCPATKQTEKITVNGSTVADNFAVITLVR